MESLTNFIKVFNTGSTRLVVCVGKYAIKIPKLRKNDSFYGVIYNMLRGWKGNRYEYIWSKTDLYPYLAKVKLSMLFSFIIIMERAESIDRDRFFSLKKSDYEFGGYEFKMDSFGVINNEVKIIDYDGLTDYKMEYKYVEFER